jgi:hypothetical protein
MLRITPCQPKPAELRLCTNCRHLRVTHRSLNDEFTCSLYGKVNLVTGKVEFDSAYDTRNDPNLCGPLALYYQGFARKS